MRPPPPPHGRSPPRMPCEPLPQPPPVAGRAAAVSGCPCGAGSRDRACLQHGLARCYRLCSEPLAVRVVQDRIQLHPGAWPSYDPLRRSAPRRSGSGSIPFECVPPDASNTVSDASLEIEFWPKTYFRISNERPAPSAAGASCAHGRPTPLKGRFMANVFLHMRPTPEAIEALRGSSQ